MTNTNEKNSLTFIDNFTFPICLVNMKDDLKILFANQSFYSLIGYTKDEMQFKFANSITRLFDAKSIMIVNDYVTLKNDHNSFVIEHSLKHKNGELVWVCNEMNGSKSDANVLYMAFTDITEYRKKEEKLTDLNKQIEFMQSKLNFDIFEYDFESTEIYTAGLRIIKRSSPEDKLPIQRVIDNGFIEPDSMEVFSDSIKKLQEGEKEVSCEFRALNENNVYHWFRAYIGIFSIMGKHMAFGILINIQAEKELTYKYIEEAQFYQAILSQQEGYGHVDLEENHVTRVGGVWSLYNEVIDKVTFSELFEEFARKVVHPDDRAQYSEIMDRDTLISNYQSGITYVEGEFRRFMEQNKMVWIKIHIHLFKNPINSHVTGLLYLKNINEQKRKELSHTYASVAETNLYTKGYVETTITNYLRFSPQKSINAFILFSIYKTKSNKNKETTQQTIANFLGATFRKNDIISKVEGNEYIIFLKDVINEDEFKNRMDSLVERFAKMYEQKEYVYHLGISFAYLGQSFAVCYRHASMALMYAYQSGKNYAFYHKEDEQELEEKPSTALKEGLYKEMQYDVTERKQSNFDSFVGENGDMAYLIDPDTYDLIYANQAFYERLGVLEEECLQKKCYEAIHCRTTPCPFCAKANWTTEKFCIYRNYNEILEQEFLIKNKLVEWNGTQSVLAISVDLSNDKSIVDSMDNGTTENDYILSGIQHMQKSLSLDECIVGALETIGEFFRADTVRCWRYDENSGEYECCYSWTLENIKNTRILSEENLSIIKEWQKGQILNKIINVDSPEAMLSYSYPMYLYMNRLHIQNQRWIPYRYQDENYLFSINNVSINFINITFMDSFTQFILSEWKKRVMLEEMMYDTYHDKLTNVLNRSCYEKFVIDFDSDSIQSIGVIVLNVNRFKNINNEKGFEFGNHCLIEFANTMRKVFDDNVIFRLSGDEFIIILINTKQNELEKHIAQLKTYIEKGKAYSVAIGYSWDNVEKDINNLADLATKAMRANKKLYYDTQRFEQDNNRLIVLNGLLTSIANKEFKVFLQAKYDNSVNKVVGAEALIRYEHEEYGIIPPIKFIDSFEKNNLIRYIDLFVFEEICKCIEKWKKEGREPITVSFNLSRITLTESDIVETIDGIFHQYDIDKGSVEIEITENDTFIGKALLFQNARKLHDAGYQISLDDFGTKHTNLNILSDIEVDVLKIDKSLIHSLGKNQKKQFILKNVIQMCNDLKIKVIAEGVETREQEEMLKHLNCHLIQGYLYSKPIPISEFETIFLGK